MNRAGFLRRAIVVMLATVVLASVFYSPVFAQEAGARAARGGVTHLLGVALGLGMIVIGAGLGIGKLAAAAMADNRTSSFEPSRRNTEQQGSVSLGPAGQDCATLCRMSRF